MGQLKALVCALVACAFMVGCSVASKQTKVSIAKDVADFTSKTNLIYGNDRYWVKDVPETETAIGTVYKIQSKELDGVTYYAPQLVGEKGFTDLTEDNVVDGEFTLGKDYTFKYSNAADWGVLAAFNGGLNNISEIKRKLELSSVKKLGDDEGLTPNSKYCSKDDNYYYVSRAYFGSSSYYGLSQFTYKAKIAWAEVGTDLSGEGRTELHELRQGVLALMLQPFANLTKCGAKKPLGGEAIAPSSPKTFKEELLSEGFYEIKKK